MAGCLLAGWPALLGYSHLITMSSFVAVPLFFFAPALITPTAAPWLRSRPVMSATAAATPVLAADEAWIQQLDLEAFGTEVRALGKRLANEEGEADLQHFNKIRNWSRLCGFIGIATMALPPNPLTICALSTWIYSRWTMIAHHTCHGGYDQHGVEGDGWRFRARNFALGGAASRARDWLDWMLPEAWNLEHNVLHHYKLGEEGDPDLVERNLEFVRKWPYPLAVKYAFVGVMSGIWKWVYYAPNTYKQLKIAEHTKATGAPPDAPGFDPLEALTLGKLLRRAELRGGLFTPVEFFSRVLMPVALLRFVLLPAPLLLLPGGLGTACFVHAVVNLLFADVLTNMHAFLTIVTNHAGSDLYRFDTQCAPNSPEFFLRQVLSSANYRTGSDSNDFLHGWLNYQTEHHCWPTLSMLSYQRAAPELRAICAKHGVPYTQESVWIRLRKTVDIMVGKASMRRFPAAALKR